MDKVHAKQGVEWRQSVEQVYEFLSDETTRASNDWIYSIGPDVCLIFGCALCQVYPLKYNCWWRCVMDSIKAGSTMTGETDGHWRCSSCCSRWSLGVCGSARLFVFHFDDDDYLFAYVGGILPLHHENQLIFLKGCTMLTHLGGKPITRGIFKGCNL